MSNGMRPEGDDELQHAFPFVTPAEACEQPAKTEKGSPEPTIEERIASRCVDKLGAKIPDLAGDAGKKAKLKDELLRKELNCEAILEILRSDYKANNP